MRYVITGDSHLGALQAGVHVLKRIDARHRIQFAPLGRGLHFASRFFERKRAHLTMLPAEFRRHTRSLPLRDAPPGPDCSYVLCAPLHTSRLFREPDWQRFDPPGMDAGAAPISI